MLNVLDANAWFILLKLHEYLHTFTYLNKIKWITQFKDPEQHTLKGLIKFKFTALINKKRNS